MNMSGGYVCPRCNKRVYFAEEVIAMSKHWHKACFVCANAECKRRLDSRNCTEREGEIYCSHCYGKMFGPKGYGFGVGAGTLNMETMNQNGATNNISHYSQAQVAPLLEVNHSGGDPSHRHSSSNSNPYSPSAHSPTGSSGSGGQISPARFTTSGSAYNSINPPPKMTTSGRVFGATEVCRRCGKAVYMAERILAGGSPFHKLTCFTCGACKKKLDSTTLCERDGEVFCKTCYGRNFGPKGYGFGVGAGTLMSEAVNN